MSNPSLGLRPLPHVPSRQRLLDATGARLKASGLALVREVWAFVKAVSSSTHIREEMLESARQVAPTQPELARRLRQAANGCWF